MAKYGLVFFCFAFISCTATQTIYTTNGYLITNGMKFKLKDKFELNDTNVLSTKHLYTLKCSGNENVWLKFYPNGRVLKGNLIIHKDNYLRDTLNTCGYYTLEGNNLTMEITDGSTSAFKSWWSILVVKGIVKGDTLFFSTDQWLGSGRNVHHFTNLKSLSGQECYYVKSNKLFSFSNTDW